MDFGFSIDSPFLTYGVSYRQILMKSAPDGAPNHDAISLLPLLLRFLRDRPAGMVGVQ